MLGLPGFASSGLASEIDAALSLDRLFAIDPRLRVLRSRHRVRRRGAGRGGGRGARSRTPARRCSCVSLGASVRRDHGEHESRVALDLRVVAERRMIDGIGDLAEEPERPSGRERGVRATGAVTALAANAPASQKVGKTNGAQGSASVSASASWRSMRPPRSSRAAIRSRVGSIRAATKSRPPSSAACASAASAPPPSRWISSAPPGRTDIGRRSRRRLDATRAASPETHP